MKYQQEVGTFPTVHESTNDLHNIGAAVIIPLLQSLVTGLIVGIGSAIVLEYYSITDWHTLAALAGLCAVLLFWLNGLRLWRHLVRLVERQWQVDLDGDGQIAEPTKTVRVQVNNSNGAYQQTDIVDMPFVDRLPKFAEGVVAGKPITVSEWVGQRAGKLFTAGEFAELRDLMLRNHWIYLVNPNDPSRGVAMTRAGLAVMRSMAIPSPTVD